MVESDLTPAERQIVKDVYETAVEFEEIIVNRRLSKRHVLTIMGLLLVSQFPEDRLNSLLKEFEQALQAGYRAKRENAQ